MSVAALNQELVRFLARMYNEGVLDRQFEDLRALQEVDNPGFVADLLTLFCDDNERVMRELDRLARPVLDFPRVDAYVHQLKGSSMSVGAKQVKIGCAEFRQAAERNDEPGCIRALVTIKREFYRAKSTFQRIIELERSIIALQPPQGPQS
ncbi:Signal transduction histidine kinase [Macleaya cordata]|uniref:Histidine-containing phosphotransfer protein n=1 Tax=Macleaya cordata TaxID=56857 RepID=A0A200Q6F3_MACCD|nr:Signal transduction histidine kinase [Macleaya cordata]